MRTMQTAISGTTAPGRRGRSKGLVCAACALAGATAMGTASAQAGFSGSIAILSHYKWSGADQNFYEDKSIDPTLQVGAFYTFKNGIYIGNWASTIKFVDNNRIDSTAYLGYWSKLGPGALDVSVGYNFYPGAAYANTTALYAIYSWSDFQFKWTGVISKKYTGLSDGRGRQALAIAYSRPLNDRLTLKGEIGRLFLNNGLKRQGLPDKVWLAGGLDYKLQDDLILGGLVTGASTVAGPSVGWRNKTRLVLSLTKKF